jgi:ribonuclease D
MTSTPLLEIDTPAALGEALEKLGSSAHLALDTEFMRESTYFAKLCLIQLHVTGLTVIVDPLALDDLSPLLRFLGDRSRLKILHAARQDIEVLAQAADRVQLPLPGPIFDTQIGAALLGLPAQIGYGDLVQRRLDHTLAKGHARTDWTRRPLTREQREYAADDVRYLLPLFENLYTDLKDRGRLDWLTEEAAELEDPALYRPHPEQAWQRLKGLDRLRPEQRSVAKALARWREEIAVSADKPRGWILNDDALRTLSDRLPDSLRALENIETIPPGTVKRRGEELLELVRAARQSPDTDAPAEFFKPDPRQLAQVTKMMNTVRNEAARLEIAPELLATRRVIEGLVYFGRKDGLESGWRADVIGRQLVQLTSA